ncbi:hypothetical protein ONS95_001470 [Cadophora gregata]|uniref:uncharacterized protein n=1 Tax=Cadophora gregata TaxID=51156 RepID=UPI0026DC6628|nr:uncharacterized protein ONS95_001470 [Cadophora gregata]KAK0111092.1 hypothetical protein ONS95_001470 [Cadophora gregata]KAK0112444.1 hypothetical protein ONS96_001683 [Cadophora gregata f. sp. sojae]
MGGTKRKSRGDTPEDSYSSKARANPSVEAKVDPTYGQRSAIPGLDEETLHYGDEEFDYDEDMDALAYLRAVRQEATTIPNLLVAPRAPPSNENRGIYEDGVGDFRGWYADGAYIAQIDPTPDEEDEEEEYDPQVAYFDSILTRYQDLRDQLSQTPPRYAVESLGRDHPTHVDKMNRDLTRFWIKKMKTVDPKAAQLACFDKGSVLRLLRLLTQGTLLKRGLGVEMELSRWIWSLLARLPERGELSSEEIGVVRELGKKAVLVGVGLKEKEEWKEGIMEVERGFDGEAGEGEGEFDVINEDEITLEADKVGEDSGEKGVAKSASNPGLMMQEEAGITNEVLENPDASPDALAAGEARILASLPADSIDESEAQPTPNGRDFEPVQEPIIGPIQPPTKLEVASQEPGFDARTNTKATIDMILTIAGESYGQRDLLEFRGQWGNE